MQITNTPNLDLEFAKSLVLKAGEQIRAALTSGYETQWKADNTPVTSIDIAVNAMVVDEIRSAYPQDHVNGEEESGGSKTSDAHTWILDPIDGTQAIGIFDTMNVCLARLDDQGQPLFGIVYNPLRDQLFVAAKDGITTCNNEPIRVSTKETIKSSYVFFGSRIQFGDLASNGIAYDRLEGEGAKIINARSLSFGCIMVATGKADGAYIGVKTPFEAASVKLIIENAGGKVTDLYGNEPGSMKDEIRGLIVSNGLIHDQLVLALKPGQLPKSS